MLSAACAVGREASPHQEFTRQASRTLNPIVPEDHTEPLTIAIPFYKGQGYLRRAIESVLGQSSPNWNLLVCDDGPESGTAELVASFGDSRIRYERNERNLGMAGNWNRCLELAETDLVNLLHNDDQLLPNYVQEMLAARTAFPTAAAFFCRAKVIDSQGRDAFSFVDFVKRYLQPGGDQPIVLQGPTAIESLMHGNFIMCPTMSYRKSRLGRERFDHSWRFALDLEFYLRLLLAWETIVGLPGVAYAYRRHGENATEIYTETMTRFEEESDLHDRIASIARQQGWASVARVASRKKSLKLHVLFRIGRDFCRFRFRSARRKWDFLRVLLGRPTSR